MGDLGAALALVRKTFRTQIAFRSRTVLAMANTFILVLVNLSVWQALYQGRPSVGGVGFSAMVANLVLGVGLGAAFAMDEFYTANRIRSGEISVDLLRPLSYQLQILSREAGRTLYRVAVEFAPTLVLCVLLFPMAGPASPAHLAAFLGATVLGWLVLFQISMVIAHISFWYFNIWSFSTFKNALVLLLSGASIPLWFLPEGVRVIAEFTPFPSLVSVPMTLYLGRIEGIAVLQAFGVQLFWLTALTVLNRVLWGVGSRKLAHQGG